MVARLGREGWEYRQLPSPALALCEGSDGLYAGTATGAILRLCEDRAEPLCQLREPIIALAAVDDTFVALGAQGLLGRVSLAKASRGALTWLESGSVGRAIAFFPADDSDCVGLVGATRFGVIDLVSGRVTACPETWEQGIRNIVFLGPQRWPYGVLTDCGEMLLVSSSLDSVRPAPLPAGAVVRGCCGTLGNGLAVAWTREGRLYRITSVDRPCECIVDGEVVLAAPIIGRSAIAAILWDKARVASLALVDA